MSTLENNIKMVVQEMGWGRWSGFIWLRTGKCWDIVNLVMEHSGIIKCGEFIE